HHHHSPTDPSPATRRRTSPASAPHVSVNGSPFSTPATPLLP
ncbi:hypothetical protein L195_g064706, partial [Trifolium pratense]